MATPTIASSKVSLTLDLPPSCIQFCPAHPEYFVVGTYNLQRDEDDSNQEDAAAVKRQQTRNGSLLVFKLEGWEPKLVQTVIQPSAILDLRFHIADGLHDILAVVSSTSTLATFRLDPNEDLSRPLKHLSTSKSGDIPEDVLFLQCNWHPTVPRLIGVTTSTGSAALLQLSEDYSILDHPIELSIANSLEAWCIAFAPSHPGLDRCSDNASVSVYCGGDDSVLRYTSCSWDETTSDSLCNAPYPPIMIKNFHQAGVTAILPLSATVQDKGRVVLTGSYDDHLRVFIIRDPHESYGLKQVELALEQNLSGGVWRLDLVDVCEQGGDLRVRVLASCMHAGARLVELEASAGTKWTCRVLVQFEEHKSMNYGSDFVRSTEGASLRCVSTSFYDCLLCVWDYEASTS